MADTSQSDTSLFYTLKQMGGKLVDSLGLSMAVIDKDGNIKFANDGWRGCQFGRTDQTDPEKLRDPKYNIRKDDLGNVVGAEEGNYLEIWADAAHTLGSIYTDEAIKKLQTVISGASSGEKFEFPYQTTVGGGWMRMEVRPLGDDKQSAVIFFRDVTERRIQMKKLEEESTKRQETFYQTIRAMSKMIYAHDNYTVVHQHNVGRLSQAIGREMGLDERVCEELWIEGLVHDVGKIIIPSTILSKSGDLNQADRMYIELHTTEGFNILEGIHLENENQGSQDQIPLALVALQHHERLDGSGYPNNLRGDAILFEARIMAVADIVDAMGSHRPYRTRKSFPEIMRELTTQRGVKYDQIAVDACIDVLEGENEFAKRYRDAV